MDILEKVTKESEQAREIIRTKGAFYLTENYCPEWFIPLDSKCEITDIMDVESMEKNCPKCWLQEVV